MAFFVCSLTASGQPADVDVVILYLFRVDEKKDFLSFLKVSGHRFSLGKVVVECINIEEVAL